MKIIAIIILTMGLFCLANAQVNGKLTARTSVPDSFLQRLNRSDTSSHGNPVINAITTTQAAIKVYSNPLASTTVFASTLGTGSGYDLSQTNSAIIGDAGSHAAGLAGFGSDGPAVFAKSSNYYGLEAFSENYIGAYISNSNASNQSALWVTSTANDYAARIAGHQVSNKRALTTEGKLKFIGINEQAGAVLRGDAGGNATWGKNMMAAAYGEINGDGTVVKGSGTFLASWDATNKEYTIVFTNDGTAMNLPVITERTTGVTATTYAASCHIINSNQFKVKKKNSFGEGIQFAFFFVVF
ncbi:MAG: hypothetical protein V4722_02790 [Bacteroidota bacterium]